MINWLKKKLGILDVEKGVVCLHEDMNKAFNRIEAITLAVGKKRVANFRERIVTRGPQRYDEIERDRKRRKKSLIRLARGSKAMLKLFYVGRKDNSENRISSDFAEALSPLYRVCRIRNLDQW